MTTQRIIENQDHEYVWELLPWYVNEGLSRKEVNEVEMHLKDCPACQNEVVRCQDLDLSVKSNQQEVWTPSAQHFSKVLANVDVLEHRRMKSQDAPNWFSKWFPWLNDTPRPARFTLALQGALVLALATTLLVRALVPLEAYQTLSNPAERSPVSGQQVRLVFAEDITEKEMRGILLGIQGRLVAGPSSLGVYTIALSPNSNTQLSGQALAQLRANPKVRLAEMASVIIE
jgi:anti-sigma factor RsiW